MIQRFSYTVDEVPVVVQQVKDFLPQVKVITLTGSLGAGKTTFMQELMKQLGVTELVTSPTFAYVHTYTGAHGKRYHHFDLYRLHSVDEFIDLGFDEYLADADAQIFIEWPEIVMPLLASYACMHLNLEYDGLDKRTLMMSMKGLHE